MSAITNRLKTVKDHLFGPTGPGGRDARLQRARKKAAAEAQRREHQREDKSSEIHRK